MQLTSAIAAAAPASPTDLLAADAGAPFPATASDARFAQYKVIRRNGSVVGFDRALEIDPQVRRVVPYAIQPA